MKKSKWSRLLTALLSCIVIGSVFLYCYRQAPFMMTNDNFYLKSIVSGEMTGAPEFRMYYMGIVFGGVVSMLYKLFPGVAWYGAAMTVSLAAVFSYLLYRILDACDSLISKALMALFTAFFIYGFFTQHIVKSEFTTITGIVGCASLLALYLLEERTERRLYWRAIVPVVLFAVWSVNMRDKAFYMLLPFIGMIFLGKLQDVYDAKQKDGWRNLVLAGMSLAVAIALCYTGTMIAYRNDAWKEFRAYTDASELVFDYYGVPDYEEHRTIYDELGITKSSYEAITAHYNILLDPAINRYSMERLADVGEREKASKETLIQQTGRIAKRFVERNFTSYTERPINILVYLLYLCLVPAALILRKKKAVRDIVFVVVARMFLWIYLIDRGRFPARVTQIIYVAEVFLLVGIVIKHELWKVFMVKRGEHRLPAGMAAGILILCLACIRFGVPVAKAHMSEARSWYEFSESYRELQDYLTVNNDKFYYFDMSHLYFEEEVFQKPRMVYDMATGKQVPARNNYLYMGSWMPHSPWYDTVFADLGITDVGEALISHENVYLLYQEVDFDSWDFLERYYEEHYPGSFLRVVDEFTASNGTKYDVIKGFRN